MTVVRRLARPLLAATFVASGVDQLRNARQTADQLQPVLQRAGSIVPQASVVTDNEMLVARMVGAVQVGAGVMLAAGKFPRLSALVLAKMAAINAIVEYRNAEQSTPEGRRLRRSQLLKNLGLVGAGLLAAVDTAGRPGLAWRASHLAEDARRNIQSLGKDTGKTAKSVSRTAKAASRTASKAAEKATAAVAGS
ncbi:DoxX family membrane protein [Arthrobacter sp. I2-34]|uniref:DoxX family membrane protein n=1 Tax=Arthrobacter hankyongi TaxID=2904801 RepID=A0ABS9L7U4_9MICC|nr:DoxX family protein [Arthrobacter hankyongi]MCG2622648.1 DoxX family membrane protein [Arthrobacter hankyongi]